MPFVVHDASQWETWHFAAWAAAILTGMHLLTVIIPAAFEGRTAKIAVRGKHLDAFGTVDWACVYFNKFASIFFVYHYIQVMWYTNSVAWGVQNATAANTLGSLLGFYLLYDLVYTLFHRLLHHRSVYGLVHKHHHKQKAPSRGNLDAINVHPLEFVCGEYLHLACVYLVPCHAYAAVVFLAAGGVFASLNHTRFDVNFITAAVYNVKNHDVHHRLPESNYGQYTMLWDRAFGSYRPYHEHDGGAADRPDSSDAEGAAKAKAA